MIRFFAILCATSVLAAPVLKPTEPEFYFPLTVGAKWVYERSDREEQVEVSAVEKVDGESVVSRQGGTGLPTRYMKMMVTSKGLRQGPFKNDDSSFWVLRTDLKSGSSWDTPEGKRTVYGPEQVEVPAGKFKALRVEWEQGGTKWASWYAPGVGEIKRVEKQGEKDVVFRLLKSFKAK